MVCGDARTACCVPADTTHLLVAGQPEIDGGAE